MSRVTDVLKVITLLWPLVVKVEAYLDGGPKPKELSSLPSTLQSEIELERAKRRAQPKK